VAAGTFRKSTTEFTTGGPPASTTIQPTTGAIGLIVLSPSQVISAVGVNGATNYPVYDYSPGQPANTQSMFYVPIEGLWEETSTLGGVVITTLIGTTIQVFSVNSPLAWPAPLGAVYTVALANPAHGVDWTYTLLAPARLKMAQGALNTAPAVATRNTLLAITVGTATLAYLEANTGMTAGIDHFCTWFPGAGPPAAPGGTPTITGNDFSQAPLPDLFLPVGAVIASTTQSIQAADQWSLLELTFSPV
jgi:hypothetical protein